MIAGVLTPVIGIAITKFVTFEFDTYRRVIQAIFIAGLILFIGGILVRNYWKGPKPDERYDPSGLWSNANRAVQEKQFDWTGIGCSLLVLGPAIFFIIGMLFAQDFEYAPFVGFGCLVLCIIVGNQLFRLGRSRRARELSEEKAANAMRAIDDATHSGYSGSHENLPQITPHTGQPLFIGEGFQATG